MWGVEESALYMATASVVKGRGWTVGPCVQVQGLSSAKSLHVRMVEHMGVYDKYNYNPLVVNFQALCLEEHMSLILNTTRSIF